MGDTEQVFPSFFDDNDAIRSHSRRPTAMKQGERRRRLREQPWLASGAPTSPEEHTPLSSACRIIHSTMPPPSSIFPSSQISKAGSTSKAGEEGCKQTKGRPVGGIPGDPVGQSDPPSQPGCRASSRADRPAYVAPRLVAGCESPEGMPDATRPRSRV